MNKRVASSLLVGMAALCSVVAVKAQDIPLDQQLLDEQVKNQRAQAAYYNAQTGTKTPWKVFTETLPSVIGTSLGAFIALGGVLLTNQRLWKLEDTKLKAAQIDELARWRRAWIDEQIKWERSRNDELERWERFQQEASERREQSKQDEILKESRLAVAELTRHIAAGGQSLSWLLWIATYTPDKFTREDVSAHDKTINTVYTELVGAQIVVAALNPSFYQQTTGVVNELYKLDATMALLAKDFEHFPEKLVQLAELYEKVHEFSLNLPNRILGIVGLPPNKIVKRT
jgi:hypothetical protein